MVARVLRAWHRAHVIVGLVDAAFFVVGGVALSNAVERAADVPFTERFLSLPIGIVSVASRHTREVGAGLEHASDVASRAVGVIVAGRERGAVQLFGIGSGTGVD